MLARAPAPHLRCVEHVRNAVFAHAGSIDLDHVGTNRAGDAGPHWQQHGYLRMKTQFIFIKGLTPALGCGLGWSLWVLAASAVRHCSWQSRCILLECACYAGCWIRDLSRMGGAGPLEHRPAALGSGLSCSAMDGWLVPRPSLRAEATVDQESECGTYQQR